MSIMYKDKDNNMKVISTARNFNIDGCKAVEMLNRDGIDFIDYGDRAFESDEERLNAVKDADIIITAVEEMQADFLSQCTNLKAVSVRGVGYDNVDAKYCHQNGITLLRALGTVEEAVSEHVMAYIHYFGRRIDLQNQYMQNGEWNRIMMNGVSKRTLGLVGFGGIGKHIARRAVACGMNVKYYCRNPKNEWEGEYGVEYLPLDELLCTSDYVSINVPLTDDTRKMVNADFIGKMKKDSILINISRGAVADYNAVKTAVESGHIAGAAVDVYENEPCTDCVLIGLDNVVLTPHTAPYTPDTFINMNERTAQNVIDYINNDVKKEFLAP